MSADEILDQSARYQIQYPGSVRHSSASPGTSPDDDEHGGLSLMESLHDDEIWARSQQIRRARAERDRYDNEDAWTRRRMERMHVSHREERSRPEADSYESYDWLLNKNEDASSLDGPVFTVTSETEDETSDCDEGGSISVIADRQRRNNRSQDDDPDSDEYPLLYATSRAGGGSLTRHGTIRSFRRSSPRRIEPREDSSAEEVAPPDAKFFMTKSRITIRFTTPLYVAMLYACSKNR